MEHLPSPCKTLGSIFSTTKKLIVDTYSCVSQLYIAIAKHLRYYRERVDFGSQFGDSSPSSIDPLPSLFGVCFGAAHRGGESKW
jgi:hypothetical protein